MSRGRRRFDEIADNYSNVPELAMRDGYPWHQCSDEMKVRLRALGEGRAEHGELEALSSTQEREAPSPAPHARPPPQLGGPRAPRALMNEAAESPQAALTPGPRIEEIGSVPIDLGTNALARAGAQVSDQPGRAEPPEVTVEGKGDVKLVLPKLRLPVLPSQLLESTAAKRRRVAEEQAAAISGGGAGASGSARLEVADVD